MKNDTALLFDVDGTLLDTEEIVFQAFEYTLNKHLHKNPHRELELKVLFGKPLAECYEILAPNADIGLLCKTHDDFQHERTDLVKPFKNVIPTLQEFKDAGYKIAAVTNRWRSSTEKFVNKTGLAPFLELIIGTEDVESPKPHPEGIEKALKHFSIAPVDAYMVGDSEFDIQAGQRTGAKTIGVTTGFHPESMKITNPDFIIDDISEMLSLLKK